MFIRTPKTFERAAWWDVIKSNRAESLLAARGAIGIAAALSRPTTLSGPLLAALLLFPTLGFAAAPFNSFAAQRAALPPDLRHRRSTEFLRQPATRGAAVAAGGVRWGRRHRGNLRAAGGSSHRQQRPGPAPDRGAGATYVHADADTVRKAHTVDHAIAHHRGTHDLPIADRHAGTDRADTDASPVRTTSA